MKIRVGFGFDAHQLKENHPFVLGGLTLPHTKGAFGHSDADVLLHVICDALLGAANLRDIGYHFPDTDPSLKGVNSKLLLQQTVALISEKGYSISNIDCTICLEKPKVNPFIPEMKEIIADILNADIDAISIKATTTEQLGYVGRQEGVSAYCVCLING